MARTKDGLCRDNRNEWNSWNAMRHRCRNEKHPFYKNYGAAGITISDEWYDSFKQFLTDMGKRPTTDHSIDRIDIAKGYSKDNCRWATKSEQARNRTKKQQKPRRPPITFNGETLTIRQWAERLGINTVTLRHRIYDYNWPLERALTTVGQAKRGRKECQFIEHQGVTKHVSEWAADAGIDVDTFRWRYYAGKWSMKDCLGKPVRPY